MQIQVRIFRSIIREKGNRFPFSSNLLSIFHTFTDLIFFICPFLPHESQLQSLPLPDVNSGDLPPPARSASELFPSSFRGISYSFVLLTLLLHIWELVKLMFNVYEVVETTSPSNCIETCFANLQSNLIPAKLSLNANCMEVKII